MTNEEFLDDVERRIRENGGTPAWFTAEEHRRLRRLAGPRHYQIPDKQTNDVILGSTGRALVREARKRMVENVAKRLMK